VGLFEKELQNKDKNDKKPHTEKDVVHFGARAGLSSSPTWLMSNI